VSICRYYSEAGPAEPGSAAPSYAVPIDGALHGSSGESCYAVPGACLPAIYDEENQKSRMGAGQGVTSLVDYAEPGPAEYAAPVANVDYAAPAYAVFKDAPAEQQRPTSVSDA